MYKQRRVVRESSEFQRQLFIHLDVSGDCITESITGSHRNSDYINEYHVRCAIDGHRSADCTSVCKQTLTEPIKRGIKVLWWIPKSIAGENHVESYICKHTGHAESLSRFVSFANINKTTILYWNVDGMMDMTTMLHSAQNNIRSCDWSKYVGHFLLQCLLPGSPAGYGRYGRESTEAVFGRYGRECTSAGYGRYGQDKVKQTVHQIETACC